ncbi:MAG: hypothetical protein V4732_06050 [Pseudomonadota bacterium]
MNNKNYFLLVLLLMVPGGVLLHNKNLAQSSSLTTLANTANPNTFLVGDVQIELDLKKFTQKIKAGYDAVVDAGSECINDFKVLKTKEAKKLAGTIESSATKLACANTGIPAKGKYSDEINANVIFN